MSFDSKQFKQDGRSPQELAKAILDHEFLPGTGQSYSITFREQMLMDYQTPHQMEHPVLSKYGSGLVWTLKKLEEGISIDQNQKRQLSHAIQVINAYRMETAAFRDDSARRATDWKQREEAEMMGTYAVGISNLMSVEKIVRSLAQKLDVLLIEPGRYK